jgi:hypothetical protein
MTVNLVIAVAEPMSIVFREGWRHGRIAETRMAANIGRSSPGDITASSVDAIVVTLLGGLRECRRWRRRRIICRLGMRASGKREGKKQHCHCERFLHDVLVRWA